MDNWHFRKSVLDGKYYNDLSEIPDLDLRHNIYAIRHALRQTQGKDTTVDMDFQLDVYNTWSQEAKRRGMTVGKRRVVSMASDKRRPHLTVGYAFNCPGCGYWHGVHVAETNHLGARWTFNGDPEKPTFEPSVLMREQPTGITCHLFVRDGMAQFCEDSTHDLRGQSVPLPEV